MQQQRKSGAAPAALMDDASVDDVPALLALDALCFPPDDPAHEPAAPSEIENGVRAGHVRVVRVGTRIVGFLQYELPTAHHLYLSGLGVHPDHRRAGVGATLLDDFLARAGMVGPQPAPSISTVTSPENLAMLGLLLSRGFVVRTVVPDYFGPGRDRFYCQHKSRVEYVDADERYLIPTAASAQVTTMLAGERHVVTGLVVLPAGPAFELSRFETDDFAALQSSESAAGIAFSSGILAAIAFVLGLSFASQAYPDGVRVLLMCAALATTASLIIYANTSGELARLRTNAFGRYTKWGNVLSEFGGVFPFLIALPVTFAKLTPSVGVALAAAVLFGATLLVYDRSTFSISARFRQSASTTVLSLLVAAAPVLGVVAVRQSAAVIPWVWTASVVLALAARSFAYLFRRQDEAAPQVGLRPWQSRR
ncbi:GNAT family N-acetyltransferase [Micromonospora sp. 067-2]|uniref:GNAT family N-acetyltransferase n=1 Tax=Micromonospora sp. 067-2 TaxID=2789270 RepID=UPI00397D1754